MEKLDGLHSEGMRTTYHRVHVELGKKERQQIAEMLTRGRESARVLRRALILRQLDQGQTAAQVAGNVGVAQKTVRPLPGVTKKKDWRRVRTKNRGPASNGCWTQARASGSLPWFAVRRPKARHTGACA